MKLRPFLIGLFLGLALFGCAATPKQPAALTEPQGICFFVYEHGELADSQCGLGGRSLAACKEAGDAAVASVRAKYRAAASYACFTMPAPVADIPTPVT